MNPKRYLIFGFALLGTVSGQPPENASNNLPYFELRRDDRPITVQQTATDAQGGFSITRGGPECRKNENLSFFYAPSPRRIETRVNNTQIQSNVVLRTQPKEGGADAQDEAVLDFFGGSLGLNEETFCPRNVERDEAQKVIIVEGRTTIRGGPLLYQNATGQGTMTGPVALNRREEDDSPALQADARRMDFNVDNDITTLRGDVTVESDGRTSRAEVLELDEEAGFAVLRGNPATSRDEEGEVSGQVIEYDLDNNDVVVTSGVQGSFSIDLGEGEEATLPDLDTSLSSPDSGDTGDTGDLDNTDDASGTTDDESGSEAFPSEDEVDQTYTDEP